MPNETFNELYDILDKIKERSKFLIDKFRGMQPNQIVDYKLANLSDNDVDEYLDYFARRDFREEVIKNADERNRWQS